MPLLRGTFYRIPPRIYIIPSMKVWKSLHLFFATCWGRRVSRILYTQTLFFFFFKSRCKKNILKRRETAYANSQQLPKYKLYQGVHTHLIETQNSSSYDKREKTQEVPTKSSMQELLDKMEEKFFLCFESTKSNKNSVISF